MKLLVTGGAGFIGSAVVRLAIARGHEVVNLDALTYAACLDNVASVAQAPGYAFVQADIRDRAALDVAFATHQPDAVMHLAAESHVDRSIDGPGDFIETNITGTYNMLEAARSYWQAQGKPDSFRFHHISTDEVFGSLPADPSVMFTEDTPYDPRSPYSASKASSDHLVRAWHETYGLPVVLTNCSNNYGPFHFPEKLIPVIILNALAGKPLPIYGDGSNIRDWLYVEDHADALLLVVEKGAVGRSYNIGGENERTNLELVQTLCGILDDLRPRADGKAYADQITFVTDRPGHDARYAIDPARIRKELGWRPSVTVEEGLRRTVQWYLDNEPWWRALQARHGVGQRLGDKGMILIFGKTGQVATELARLIPDAVFLGRDQADLGDPQACAQAIHALSPRAVINAAAYTAVDKAEQDEALATTVNGAAPTAMAQACAALDIPLVHISTDYVFDGRGDAPWKPTDPVSPQNAYGRSKLAGEEGIRASGARAVILRTSWVFSAHGNNFVKTMLRLSETRDALSIVDDQIGGPTPARGIAAACLTIANALMAGQGGGTYHYAGTPAASWKCFARETFDLAGRKVQVTGIPTADYPTPAKRPLNSRLDCSSLTADFGISPPDWKAALAETVTELRS